MARRLIVGEQLHIFKGTIEGKLHGGYVVELHGRHHALVHETHVSVPQAFHVVTARQHGWESVAAFGSTSGGVDAARALAKSRASIHRKVHKQVVFLGIPYGDCEGFFASIEGTYQDALDDLRLTGFWLVCALDDGYVCGWSIGCPDGDRIQIPAPESRPSDGSGPAYVDRIVDAFFEAEAHRVVPASPAVRAA